MLDELQKIDITAVEALQALKQDQRRLEDLKTRAHERKRAVSPEIFLKVTHDYAVRLEAIEAAARPLRARAKAELARLLVLHDRLEQALTQARLDKEELEFRHDLGELEEGAFQSQQEQAARTLDSCGADFEDSERLKKLFVDVLPADEIPVPEAPVPETPVPQAAVPQAPVPEAPAPEALVPEPPGRGRLPNETAAWTPKPPLALDEPADAARPVPRSGDEVTLMMTSPLAEGVPGLAPDEDVGGGTQLVRWAHFLETRADGSEVVHALGPAASVGRTADNDIVIPQPGVSRKHARVELADDGYVIRDLGSNNGTWVNGKRVTECALKEGDEIQIGRSTFRLASR